MLVHKKEQYIKIRLLKIGAGLEWEPNKSTGHDIDLDTSGFMFTENKKLFANEFFIFYNNQKFLDNLAEEIEISVDNLYNIHRRALLQ